MAFVCNLLSNNKIPFRSCRSNSTLRLILLCSWRFSCTLWCSGRLTYHSKEFAIRNGEFYNSIIKKTCNIKCIIGTKSHSFRTIKITLITKGTYKPAKGNNEQKKVFQMKLPYFVYECWGILRIAFCRGINPLCTKHVNCSSDKTSLLSSGSSPIAQKQSISMSNLKIPQSFFYSLQTHFYLQITTDIFTNLPSCFQIVFVNLICCETCYIQILVTYKWNVVFTWNYSTTSKCLFSN